MASHSDYSRRDALRLLRAGALAPLAARAQNRRPNILILYGDDLGWHDVGFNGRKEWDTPNLDRLASQGTVFNRWYTGSPLCAPSRACLLTGRYGIHTGVRTNGPDLPAEEVTLAEALKKQNYTTAIRGKWHHGNKPGGGFTHPLDQGFDSTFGFLNARHAWEHFPKELYRGRESVPVQGFTADLFANEAVEFINGHKADPFFLYVPFIEPHFNIEAPPEEVARFKGKFKERDPAKPLNATYAAMIHRMDAGIGRILKALDDAGLADNTVVFFSSDNGATFEAGNQGTANAHDSNYPFRGQKRSLEEGGIRMPVIWRWPGKIPAGKRSEEPLHMIDVFPTMLGAAGGQPDPAWKVDGTNVMDVLQGRKKAPERTLFWEWQVEGWDMRAAMRGDYKLLDIGGNRFLYNIPADPGERRTLGAEQPAIYKQLQAELKAWLATEVKR